MKKILLPLFLVVMMALASGIAFAQEEGESSGDEPDCAAFINAIVGTVETQAADAEDTETWTPAELYQCLNVGDRVRTGEDGKTAIKYAAGVQMRANANTTLTTSVDPEGESEDPDSIDMEIGELFTEMDKEIAAEGTTFKVNTPAGVVAVRGTEFNVAVDAEGKAKVNVLDGVVAVFNELGEVLAEAGKATEMLKDMIPENPFDFDIEAFQQQLDSWKDAINIGAILEGVNEKIDEEKEKLKENLDVKKKFGF